MIAHKRLHPTMAIKSTTSKSMVSLPVAAACCVHLPSWSEGRAAAQRIRDAGRELPDMPGEKQTSCVHAEARRCFRCQVPLMRDPRTHDRLCVNCDECFKAGQPIPVRDYEDEEAPAIPDPAISDESSDNLSQDDAGRDVGARNAVGTAQSAAGEPSADKPWHAPWRKASTSHQKTKDISQLLSDKMLQGWALLEMCCPRCELPRICRMREN